MWLLVVASSFSYEPLLFEDCVERLMLDRAMLFGLVASIGALLFILELVRQRRLKEEYSLLWLATAIVLLILSVSRPLLDTLASLVGIFYPPSALFLVAVVFILFILLQFSTALTRLSRENKEIAQQMAIMKLELEQARKASARDGHTHDQQGDQSGDEQG
jgi:hypothetical protein